MITKCLKSIIRFFCIFIPNKHLRRECRKFLFNWSIVSTWNYHKSKNRKVRKNSVLIIEANDCHGEVLPGYAKYFLDMGYNVNIIMHSDVYKSHPFCRMNSAHLSITHLCSIHLHKLSKLDNLKDYQYILVNSSAYYNTHNPQNVSTLQVLNLQKFSNLLVVEHDLKDITEFGEESLLKDNKLLVLGNFGKGLMVNPHFFGKISITPKNDITNFIVVGGIAPQRKNHQLLLSALEKLLASNCHNFKITIIGRGKITDIPQSHRSYIDIKGYLDFPKMYQEMEQADFFLTLLDANNQDHYRYITTGVTGSAQLIYGFAKLPIIPQTFAEFYGFNSQNAIVYDGDNLALAMQEAIDMTAQEYQKKQQNLQHLADKIYQQSLSNLKKALK